MDGARFGWSGRVTGAVVRAPERPDQRAPPVAVRAVTGVALPLAVPVCVACGSVCVGPAREEGRRLK